MGHDCTGRPSPMRQARAAAVIAAALARPGGSPAAIIDVAEGLAGWIARGRLSAVISPITYEQGSAASVPTRYITGGDQSMASMTDTQQFTASIEVEDSKGFDTTDANALTWSEDSGGAVVTLQPSADGLSCVIVAVAPGTANYSVTDGTLTGGGSAVVTAGAASQIVVSESAPADQAPAAQ